MKKVYELGISPAPWWLDWQNDIIGQDGRLVAFVTYLGASCKAEELVNARLLAAAPELYEALREVYEDFHTCFGDGECGSCPCGDTCEKWGAKARAALEKAGGAE